MDAKFVVDLMALAWLGFVQNMAFTFSSRSRNSGDPDYHRYAAILSNGIWFLMTLAIWNQLFTALTHGAWLKIAIVGIVYVVSTTEGSVFMMKIMLRKESGKRKVGAT